jgi:4-hydroxy-2-oxoglutarate aldolase
MAITNGSRAKAPHIPPSGVWVPAITFFDPSTDTLDLTSQKQYYTYLSTTGLSGLVILGTNAEAFLLTRSERSTLIALAREAVGPSYPLIAGCGAHSTAQVLEHISDAHASGADYALVLPPAYFGRASTPGVIENFFLDVASKSALPVVIYNFPGVCNGVDMDSDLIARIVRRAAGGNVVGVKLTCASVGKITRLAATFAPREFAVFGGQSDFLIGGLAAGSAGCIAAFGNVFPKSIVRIYELWMAEKVEEARVLHGKAALAESPVKAGIAAVKFASAAVGAAKAAGIEGAEAKSAPRRPYEPLEETAKGGIRSIMAEMAKIEASL